MRIAVVGAGAFGEKHLDALKNIDHVEVKVVVSVSVEEARKLADKFGVAEVSDSYEDVLKRDDIDAVILTTPTPMHARRRLPR
jgi:2-hydroxy-4-carboxymuconate semialdehyde hemiacetal dehydrogenase